VVPLSEVAFFQEGPGILAKDFRDHGVPLIRLKGVEGDFVTLDGCNYLCPEKVAAKWSHFQLNRGDLIISTSASFGRVSEVTEDAEGAIPYTGLIRFRPSSPQLDRSYLRAFLNSAAFMQQVEAMASGSVIRHFGPTHLKQMALFLPPLEEQRAIGQLSDLFADRLRLLRQTNVTLEAIAQALFKSWFVDFDPVRAKAEGREPEGMDAATAALFPSEFEDSELGPIPKGWRIGASDEFLQIVGGGTPKTSVDEYWGGDIPWFSVVDAPASGQVFTLDTAKKITDLGLANCSAKLLPAMTTIISARGTVGKVAMTGVPMAMNQSCYALRPRVEGGEAFIYFSTLRFVEQLRQIAHGAVFDTVTRDSFKRIMTCLPPEKTITSFGLMTGPLLERIRTNGLQAASLAALRDTLLPRLISGKLRLPEAESILQDTTA